MATLKINQRTIAVRCGQSLLEAAEQVGINVEYQCRNGFCGACRKRLTSGKVNYPTPPLAYCDENEVLLCCAYLDEHDEASISLIEQTEKLP
ncbi:class I ribonucleotide reductase maintenance protein YfaE [Celerinatantimonas yamalensis]|uniref:Class I ribonucleotide reductase maintenance protein YfaE n=1 Tax=Celerinatantimonas yamalensis TaxID=559956 RepID=A0ABW9G628_9GAMM